MEACGTGQVYGSGQPGTLYAWCKQLAYGADLSNLVLLSIACFDPMTSTPPGVCSPGETGCRFLGLMPVTRRALHVGLDTNTCLHAALISSFNRGRWLRMRCGAFAGVYQAVRHNGHSTATSSGHRAARCLLFAYRGIDAMAPAFPGLLTCAAEKWAVSAWSTNDYTRALLRTP